MAEKCYEVELSQKNMKRVRFNMEVTTSRDSEETHQSKEAQELEMKRMKEIEEELQRLEIILDTEAKEFEQWSLQTASNNTLLELPEDEETEDERSVCVGNVDDAACENELKGYFQKCGSIKKVTIICDQCTGRSKNLAYIEFLYKDSVELSMTLNGTLFKGRQIKVTQKRINRPEITSTNTAAQSSSAHRPEERTVEGGPIKQHRFRNAASHVPNYFTLRKTYKV